MKPRRAVSPAIVTMLLMTVAFGGGLAIWQSMHSQILVLSKEARIDVVDISLIGLQTNKTFFSAVLKNSGTLPFDTVEIGFWDDYGSFHLLNGSSLLPGDQWAGDRVFDVSLTSNQQYVVRISATSDASKFVMAKTVMAD